MRPSRWRSSAPAWCPSTASSRPAGRLTVAVEVARASGAPADAEAVRRRAVVVEEALRGSPSGFLAGYPGQYWPCDTWWRRPVWPRRRCCWTGRTGWRPYGPGGTRSPARPARWPESRLAAAPGGRDRRGAGGAARLVAVDHPGLLADHRRRRWARGRMSAPGSCSARTFVVARGRPGRASGSFRWAPPGAGDVDSGPLPLGGQSQRERGDPGRRPGHRRLGARRGPEPGGGAARPAGELGPGRGATPSGLFRWATRSWPGRGPGRWPTPVRPRSSHPRGPWWPAATSAGACSPAGAAGGARPSDAPPADLSDWRGARRGDPGQHRLDRHPGAGGHRGPARSSSASSGWPPAGARSSCWPGRPSTPAPAGRRVSQATAVQDLQLALYAEASRRGWATGEVRLPRILAGPDAATEVAGHALRRGAQRHHRLGRAGGRPWPPWRPGSILALANKESLVIGGPLVTRAAARRASWWRSTPSTRPSPSACAAARPPRSTG